MQLKALLISLRSSMWFIPMTMVAVAILLAYSCRQLVDIALKALAPSSDDTTTAVLYSIT